MRDIARPAAAEAAALLLACLAIAGLSGCVLDVPYDKYAIVYGVADYEGGTVNDLDWPYEDAVAMEAMLSAQGYVVWLQTNSAANLTSLLADIGSVALAASEDDLFVFYFSGHGAYNGTGPEPAAADTYTEWINLWGSLADPAQTLSDDQLLAAFAPIAARKKVIILDSCYSGGYIGNELEADGEPSSLAEGSESIIALAARAVSLYANFDGSSADIPPWEALVLSACGESERSWESSSYGHGVFTYYLLEAESEGDRNGDGWVTVTEAYDYIQENLYANWSQPLGLYYAYAPHVSGGPVDYVLFEAR